MPTRRIITALLLALLATLSSAWLAPAALRNRLPIRWTIGVHAAHQNSLGVRSSHTLLRDYTAIEPINPSGPFYNGLATPPTWVTLPSSWSGIDRSDTDAVGFPFRALTCRTDFALAPSRGYFVIHSTHGGLLLSRTSDLFGTLPCTPLWLGLLADLAIWSAVSYLALTALNRYRTYRAKKRIGVCPKCRYDRTGLPPTSPCPECGTLAS